MQTSDGVGIDLDGDFSSIQREQCLFRRIEVSIDRNRFGGKRGKHCRNCAEGIKDTYEFRSLKNRTSVGTWTEIDYEKIGEVVHNGSQNGSSDALVLCFVYPGKPNGVEAISNNLAAIGMINVLGLDFYKEENLSREMMLLGSVLGREESAEEVMDWHDNGVAEAESAVAGMDRPKVFIEGSSKGYGDITTFGKQSGSAIDSDIRPFCSTDRICNGMHFADIWQCQFG